MQEIITITTHKKNELYDITKQVEEILFESGKTTGLVNVYAQGATCAIMM